MPVILSVSIQRTVTAQKVVITWDTDIDSNTDLKLAQISSLTSPLPAFDTLPDLGEQESSTKSHTFTLTVGNQIQAGQIYGFYPVSVDPDTTARMNCDGGGHCAGEAFQALQANLPVGKLVPEAPAGDLQKDVPTLIYVKATDAGDHAVVGASVRFEVAIGRSPGDNHGTWAPTAASTGADGRASSNFTPARPGTIQLAFKTLPAGATQDVVASLTVQARP